MQYSWQIQTLPGPKFVTQALCPAQDDSKDITFSFLLLYHLCHFHGDPKVTIANVCVTFIEFTVTLYNWSKSMLRSLSDLVDRALAS